MKAVRFHPKAIEFIRSLPDQSRKQIGEAIRDLQKGLTLTMPLSRPMPDIASGVSELRIKEPTTLIRVFYAVKYQDRIMIFHAFQKKTQKTPQHEIELAKARLKELIYE